MSDLRETAGRKLQCLHATVGENVRRQGPLGATLEAGHLSGRGCWEVVQPLAPLEGEHREDWLPEVRSQVFLPAHLLSTHRVPPEEGQWAE